MPEPPYEIIARAISAHQVVPFLGAGVNYGVLPLGAELSQTLADAYDFPSDRRCGCDRNELAKTAQWFEQEGGRGDLQKYLREELKAHVPFNSAYLTSAHSFLAEISHLLRLVITTNFDDLLERAFVLRERPFYQVVYGAGSQYRQQYGHLLRFRKYDPQHPDRFFNSEPEPVVPNEIAGLIEEPIPIIYKMHGTVDRHRIEWESYVITEEDYVDFLSAMAKQNAIPPLFGEIFLNSRFLFLGYGLGDWNWRVVLRDLTAARRKGWERSWAIQRDPSDLETGFWKQRDVNIYDLEISEFIEELKQRLV